MSTRVETPPERLTARMAWAMLALLLAGVGIIIALQFARGSDAAAPADEEHAGPAQVVHVEGSNLPHIRLTPAAAARIDLQTATVRRSGRFLEMPWSSLIYDADGNGWVYRSVDRLAFQRHAVTVVRIDGDRVIVSRGPRAGTRVASVGVPELYGTEFEVGH
jgi:hypothetical protein